MSMKDGNPVSPKVEIKIEKNDVNELLEEEEPKGSKKINESTNKDKENSDEIGGGELDYEEEIAEPAAADKKEPFPGDQNELSSVDKNETSCSNTKESSSDPVKEKLTSDKKEAKEVEEGEDEGEISGEEDDLEEGELKENNPGESSQSAPKQICRFFTRGQCYYGSACRFLHLSSGKGQYNMFAKYSDGYGPAHSDRGRGMDYMPPFPSVPMPVEQSYVESAWERGLREAKELVKKANKRKEEEPDFDKKKNYLTINFNEKNTDFDKENDFVKTSFSARRNVDMPYKSSGVYEDTFDNRMERGAYENFEIHYNSRDEMMPRMTFDRRVRDRSSGRLSAEPERDRYSKDKNKDRGKVKDDRALLRTRAFEYVDPWRRSKTPKARGGRSRSGSYSSVSSSYSERSSRSASASYSKSSSRSSVSSRSPSVPKQKGVDPGFPKMGANRLPFMRKKPPARSPSVSSRSRSPSSARSRSRSYSRSRSISMDSVSSESSMSHSSHESLKKDKIETNAGKPVQKLPLELLDVYREQGKADPTLEDIFDEPPENTSSNFSNYRHLIPGNEKVKPQQKQPIKLTLLRKPTLSKTGFPKKEADRPKVESKTDLPVDPPVAKRPLSPTLSALHAKPDPTVPKKSASSRRDELLKQLKAVEDAIARKRAKLC